jgi:hypothetical protein
VNPPTVSSQGVVFYVLTVLALFLGGTGVEWCVFTLIAFTLVLFLGLNIAYARSLAGMDASVVPWAGKRSVRRANGDRLVGRVAFFGTLPLTLACLLSALRVFEMPRVHHVPGVITVTVVAAALGVFGSSLVDWYWVLPRRDGVIGPPPCHEDWARSRKLLTRYWLIHRTVAALLFVLALVALLVGVIALLGYWLPKTSYNALFISTVAVPVTVASIPLVPWFRGMLSLLPTIGSSFHANIGDFVDVENEGTRHTVLVYDVSLDKGYGVIPLDLTHGSFTVQPADAQISSTPRARQGARCAGPDCGGWDLSSPSDASNHGCDWGRTRTAERGIPIASTVPPVPLPVQPDKTVPSNRLLILR